MRPHKNLQEPDTACTWPMHPTISPWGDGPHQLRYKYYTPNRDTHQPRTDTHRTHTGQRDCRPVDSAPEPTGTRLGTLTGDATLHPPPPGRRSASAAQLQYHTHNRHAHALKRTETEHRVARTQPCRLSAGGACARARQTPPEPPDP